jgi:hypothetical protein
MGRPRAVLAAISSFHSHEFSDNLKEWAMFADEPLK